MPIDEEKVRLMRQQLEEAERQLLLEDGRRYKILKRIIPDEEMQRYLSGLTVKEERILFRLELPEAPKGRGRRPSGETAAKRGGHLKCPIDGEGGFSERGFKLHASRKHKGETVTPIDERTGEEVGEAT